VYPATADTINRPTKEQFIPNIKYSDLVARFLELDIAPQKHPKALILWAFSNLLHQHSMSQQNLVYTKTLAIASFSTHFSEKFL
jgi:hypothetical protein